MAKWKKSKIITVSSIIAVLMIGIIVFLCFVPTIQKNTELKKYYNKKVADFEIDNKEFGSVDIVFAGDELTEEYDLRNNYLNLSTINRGIKGDDTYGLLKRLKVSVYDLNPDYIVLLIGSNNLSSMLKNYDDILADIDKFAPKAKVIVQSIYPTSKKYAGRNEKIVEVNKKLKELAEEYDCFYADVHSVLVDSKTGEMNEKYSDDGFIPNKTGYQKVTEVIKSFLL